MAWTLLQCHLYSCICVCVCVYRYIFMPLLTWIERNGHTVPNVSTEQNSKITFFVFHPVSEWVSEGARERGMDGVSWFCVVFFKLKWGDDEIRLKYLVADSFLIQDLIFQCEYILCSVFKCDKKYLTSRCIYLGLDWPYSQKTNI